MIGEEIYIAPVIDIFAKKDTLVPPDVIPIVAHLIKPVKNQHT